MQTMHTYVKAHIKRPFASGFLRNKNLEKEEPVKLVLDYYWVLLVQYGTFLVSGPVWHRKVINQLREILIFTSK